MNIIKFYKEFVSPEWQNVLNSCGFVRLLLEIEEIYAGDTSLIPKNPKDLIRPFIDCPLKDLRVVMVGPAVDPSDRTFNGVLFGSHKTLSLSTAFLIKELQNYKGEYITSIDRSMKPWSSQGVLLLSSLPMTKTSEFGTFYELWDVFYTSLLTYLQNNLKTVLFIYLDYEGVRSSFYINLLPFKSELILGSGFFEQMNAALVKNKVRPVDWLKIIKDKPTYDTRKIMLRSRRFEKTDD